METRDRRYDLQVRKPAAAAGYTGNTVITEWLTLHCRGDWASRSRPELLEVRLSEPGDVERLAARFEVVSPGATLR